MNKHELLSAAKSLTKDQRIDLALELWESIELDDHDPLLTEDQKRELDRRLKEDDANPAPDEDWSELRARLLRGDF